MCIAIVKPRGINFPAIKILQCGFKNNPDGAGFAFSRNGKNYIYKGFFTFDEFWQKILELGLNVDDTVLIHFRLSSNGNTTKSTCHPFPITDNIRSMTKTFLKTKDDVLIHNGTFKGLVGEDKNITDTMNLCLEMSSFSKLKDFNLINFDFEENKLAVMSADGNFNLYGNWFNVNGIFYSNKRFNIWNEKTNLVIKCEYGLIDEEVDNNLVGFFGSQIMSKKIFSCECCKKIFQNNKDECITYIEDDKEHKLCVRCSNSKGIFKNQICSNCLNVFDYKKIINSLCPNCKKEKQKPQLSEIDKIVARLYPKKESCVCESCNRVFNNSKFICVVKNKSGKNICIKCYKEEMRD